MADYLSRHPSESKIKAEDLWHDWLTVNEITKTKFVSEIQSLQNKPEQPIRMKLDGASELVKTSELARESKQCESANESSGIEERKTKKQTIKPLASIIKTQSSTCESEREVDNYAEMNDELIQAANMAPIKTPICYSINQIEVLQQLRNHIFKAHYESDEFMQKIIGLLKKPGSTKISRFPHLGKNI